MYLTNMPDEPDTKCSSDFNFSPSSVVTRESGDGDSGAESKESQEFDETLNHYQNDIQPNNDNDNHKPVKDRKILSSKIPVRQTKPLLLNSIIENSGSIVLNEMSSNTPHIVEIESNAVEIVETKELAIFGNVLNRPSIQTGSDLCSIEQKPNPSSNDLHDIFNDLTCNTNVEETEFSSSSSSSLSPQPPTFTATPESLNETILEAPEEFRCQNKMQDGNEPQAVCHDDDNAYLPETGDTTELAHTDKDGDKRGSEQQIQNNTICHNNNKVVAEQNSSALEVPQDNGHVQCDRIVTDLQHVGITTPHDDDKSSLMNDVQPSKEIKKQTIIIDEDSDTRTELLRSSPMLSSSVDEKVCANQPTAEASIEIGVAQCAQTLGCSRVSAAKVCAALDLERTKNFIHSATAIDNILNSDPINFSPTRHENNNNTSEIENQCNNKSTEHLSWRFKNGRLVFETAESKSVLDVALGGHDDDEQVVVDTTTNDNPKAVISQQKDLLDDNNVLYSRDLNKRTDESRSRLKYLEQKLKEAGITDNETNSVQPKLTNANLDANENIVEPEDIVDFAGSFCQFDVRQVNSNLTNFNGFQCEVYDEFEQDDKENSSSEEDCSDDDNEENIYHIIKHNKPINNNKMGTDGEKSKHNPDRDNLKSLLKKPGKKDKQSNRVVFNENKNEFFDADYIILIREECDYDDEDDDGVCTCNQHEMVRLTCCEPNCNCSVYEGYDQTPQSPKFAPPIEFVDAVTLSPPEGYKDMELGEEELLALQQMARRGQRAAVCRECSATHDDDDEQDEGEGCQSSDTEVAAETEAEEKEKTDQSQQTTPTTPPNDSDNPNYILETITMTTVTEHRILRDADDERKIPSPNVPPGGSPISGILKGGRLWKQQSLDASSAKPVELQQPSSDSNVTSDEEGNNRRSVRFIESEQDTRDICDGAPDNPHDEIDGKEEQTNETIKPSDNSNNSTSPESTEMMLTFKLGNHVLISNNSLKPNSAVRQLFPCTKPLAGKGGDDESIHQYLVTAESLRAFEEAKRSKLPQIIQSGETDESIKRAIERNTLRRSLIRYEPRSKKTVQKTDNSLVERIKQLTCDVDDVNHEESDDIAARVSPPGEEARNSPEVNSVIKNQDKSFSPSSSSTASSNSSSMSSTYKKITDLFGKRDKLPDVQNNFACDSKIVQTLPDIAGQPNHDITDLTKMSANDSRRQFLSTLAPLTACVSSIGGINTDEYYYHLSGNQIGGERASVASSVGTEYSLEDIDEGLKTGGEEEGKRIAPDVLAGTPSASESGDELAMFVQQDASRIERIKKKYQPDPNKDEDDEHDDYGFNRRPSVRGIKPRFGSTTEILQQIQNQLQPSTAQTTRVAWPYYSETALTTDNTKARNINQNQMPNYPYANVPEDVKARNFAPQYRPTSLQDDNLYQNCANQRCVREVYRSNVNSYSQVVRVAGGGTCTEYYQSLPRTRNGRPQSPPPLELSKNFHQTMVYIPYNHIEGYQPVPPPQTHPYYHQTNDFSRVSNQNQINKRYIEPIYQQRIHPNSHVEDPHYNPMPIPKPVARMSLPNGQPPHHLVTSRSESPLPGQFSTARSTQTPSATLSTCNYYQSQPRYRPMVGPVMWQGEGNYVTKMNRHSFPAAVPRYPTADNISLTDSDSQHSGQMLLPNGYHRQQQPPTGDFCAQKDSMPNSPTKPRFIERGVPEGAASVSPQDTNALGGQNSSSTMTSPTSPQNPAGKPLFYAMNV